MGKRSNFIRIDRDFYPTPKKAVAPLIKHLHYIKFIEPCAGDGRLINHLESYGLQCILAMDIDPQGDFIIKKDATRLANEGLLKPHFDMSHCFITNPPWSRKLLHAMITELIQILPTWLLFDADWMHTQQAVPYLQHCEKIVKIGRVKWIEDSPGPGKDNCCWYLFQKNTTGPTRFYND